MRIFLGIRFPGNDSNRDEVESVIDSIEKAGVQVYCVRRDLENWGTDTFMPGELMKRTFAEIVKSDILIADVSDWPMGVGVEAGFAFGKDIPVICICRDGKKVASTVAGPAEKVIVYKSYDELTETLRDAFPLLKKKNVIKDTLT